MPLSINVHLSVLTSMLLLILQWTRECRYFFEIFLRSRLLDTYPEVEFLGHILIFNFEKFPYCFSGWLQHFTFLFFRVASTFYVPTMWKYCSFLHHHQHWLSVLNNSHPNRCDIISHSDLICISGIATRAYFHIPDGYFVCLLWKMSIQVL